jgi:hypothetical protein
VSLLDYHLAVAIDDAVADIGQRPLARQIGVPHNVIAAHGSNVAGWPADQLLRLADVSDSVRGALIARVEGDKPRTTSTTERSGMLTVRDAAAVIRDLSEAMSDGRIEAAEARRLLTGVRTLMSDLRILESSLMIRSGEKP